MALSRRVKRPPLERSRPIRSWSTLFGVPSVDATVKSSASGPAQQTDPPQSLNDVVSRSVSLGYQVVDEYIRQGHKAAERLRSRTYGAETMAGDAQDLAVRMMQYASDFAAVWLDFVQLAAVNQSPPPSPAAASRTGTSGPGATPAAAAPASAAMAQSYEDANVRMEIVATQPIEVSFDLRPGAGTRPLIVHALRAVDADKPRLTDVGFQPASEGQSARFRIRVPDGQPPGLYRGIIVDEQTSHPVGSIGVLVVAD